eukprot:IDg4827t1
MEACHVNDVPKNANIIGGRFVCEIKNFGTDNAKAKASRRTWSCLEWSRHLIRAHKTSLRDLMIPVTIGSATFNSFLKDDLELTPLSGDPALHIKKENSVTTGILGAYVDDSMFAVGPGFEYCIDRIKQRFDAKSLEWDNVDFIGIRTETDTTADGSYVFKMYQPEHLEKLDELGNDITYERFRSVRACVGWLAHSRPELCCSINRAAQVTDASFEPRHVKDLNKAIRYAKESKSIRLRYGSLDMSSLHLRASRKSRRVVRSIMAAETYAFTNAFDQTFVLKHDMEKMLHKTIPLKMFTDSKQLFDVITKASYPTEKRLMIDILAVREAYNTFEISNVGLISGTSNPADALTKPNFSSSLMNIILHAQDKTPVLQWIFRAGPKTSSSLFESAG